MPIFYPRPSSRFDPPTLFDSLTSSPLRFLVNYIYSILLFLRGAPFQPARNKPPVRIVCIADTHGSTPPIPAGDLLVHAGDLTNTGTAADIQAQLDWLNALPHKEKIVIAGNHDSWFDKSSRKEEDKKSGGKLRFGKIHYLENQSITLKFKGGRKLNFYGAPAIPKCGGEDFAFQYGHTEDEWTNTIPSETDVLITVR